jgi:hypothetical protein
MPNTAQEIRQTLESTGDLRPLEAAETFMVPPDNLVEAASPSSNNIDNIDFNDFDSTDDDSLDLDSAPDSLDLGGGLDDLDDE